MATKPPRENMASTEEPGEVLATTQLQVRALGLTGALMQNITAIAPAITAFFFTATIVGFTGAISPFAYFLGFLVVLALGMCLVQLAKLFPSAGGYFTYVSRTLGPRAGFLTGWAYTLYSPIIAGPSSPSSATSSRVSSRRTMASTSRGGFSRWSRSRSSRSSGFMASNCPCARSSSWAGLSS